MVPEIICKASYSKNEVVFESEYLNTVDINEITENDKKYGVMKPRNGRYFTFRAMDWQSRTITNRQIIKAITLAWQQAEIEIDIDVKRAKEGEYADFKIYFRSTADDPELSRNTIMYHYYPISDFDNPKRGVCVVNTDFDFSMDGEPVSMFLIDQEHYTEDTKVKGETIDFDGVYSHEGPGHGLGLPHVKIPYNLLYPNYSYMVEVVSLEEPHITIPRWKAKYPVRPMISRWRTRWRQWYRVRSDKY